MRLTPARGYVLEVLLESHRALTAYELLDRLREAGLGNQPPTVYRALDFLVENGLVHRIERLGAFVACTLGARAHLAAFLICRKCKAIAETSIETPGPRLDAQAEAVGFSVERVVLEAEGICAACRAAEPCVACP